MFVHGCFWHAHSCPHGRRRPVTNAAYWRNKIKRNKFRDRRAAAALRKLGWKVLVLWECQLRDTKRLTLRIRRAIAIRPI